MTLIFIQCDMVKKLQQLHCVDISLVLRVTRPLILMSGLLSVTGLVLPLQPRMLQRLLQPIRVLPLKLKLKLGNNLPQQGLLMPLQCLLLQQIRYEHFILYFIFNDLISINNIYFIAYQYHGLKGVQKSPSFTQGRSFRKRYSTSNPFNKANPKFKRGAYRLSV